MFRCLVASRKQQLMGADFHMTPQCLGSMNEAIARRRNFHRRAYQVNDQPVVSGAWVIEINGTPIKPEEQSLAAAPAPVHSFVRSPPAEPSPSVPTEESCLCKMTPGHIVALQAGPSSQFFQIDPASSALVVSDLNTDDDRNIQSTAFLV
jgi:hypothetical protein